jgi:MFS family permease
MWRRLFTAQFVRLTTAHFFYWAGLIMFIPIIPLHYYNIGMSDFEIGLVAGSISLCGIFFRIPAGKLLNRFGTAPILGIGLVLTLIGTAGHFFAAVLETAVLSALLQGLGMACYASASLAMASFMFDDNHIVDVFSVFTMAGMFGVSLALAAANFIYNLDGIKYVVIWGMVSVTCSLILFPKRPDIVVKIKETATLSLKKLIANPKVHIPTISIFSTHVAFSGAMTFLPLLMLSRGVENFDVFFITYSVSVVIFRILTVKLCQIFELRHIESVSIGTAALTMLFIAVTETWWLLVFCGVLLGLCMGTGYPSMGAIVAANTSHANRGIALSLFASAADLGLVTGAAGLAVIAGFWGYSALFVIAGIAGIFYTVWHQMRLSGKLAHETSTLRQSG